MRVAVYYPTDNEEHKGVLWAFARGIKGAQWMPLDTYRSTDAPDVAVVFGVFKFAVRQSFRRGAVIAAQQILGKRTIVLEKGYVNRDRYYAAGWYKHYEPYKLGASEGTLAKDAGEVVRPPGGLNGRADFVNEKSPPDRWEQLGVELGWGGGDCVMLCAQVPHDASVQHSDHVAWLSHATREITKRTDRKVLFRPHPLYKDVPMMLGTEWSTAPLDEELARCSTVVTFNSNVGVLAAIAGCNVVAVDEGSMALRVADRTFDNVDAPPPDWWPAREQWAYDLAYTQWTREEMSEGLAWGHLTKEIEQEAAA